MLPQSMSIKKDIKTRLTQPSLKKALRDGEEYKYLIALFKLKALCLSQFNKEGANMMLFGSGTVPR
jgi:hypothetical protein